MTFVRAAAAISCSNVTYHLGLPQGWNRDRFRQLCVGYAQLQGASAECVRTLEIIIDKVPPQAFTDPRTEPCCYARQETLLGERGITSRAVLRHEKTLEGLGLIDRRTGANGSRCQRKRLGLFLTPALNMLPMMQDALAEARAERAAHDALRGDRSRLLRHVKAAFATLIELEAGGGELDDLIAQQASWPRSDKLAALTLQEMSAHIEAGEVLLRRLLEIARDHSNLPGLRSGQPDPSVGPHIQDQIEDRLLSCNAIGEDQRPSGKPSVSSHPGSDPDGSEHCLEKDDAAASEERNLKSKLPRLTNSSIYALASEDFQMHVDIAGGGNPNPAPSLYEIEKAAWTRLSELGTNISAWHDAIDRMGLLGAIVAAVLTDAKVSDPRQPVANPGGYFRGLVRAAERDDLNLVGGWMGLVARRIREEKQG